MTPPDWVVWVASHFSPEQYLFWTRWQCLSWTLADLFIVLFLIRLSNQARRIVDRPPQRFPYLVLLFTAALVPFLVHSPNGGLLFLVELGITIPHFLLLCYLLTANIRVYAEFLAAVLAEDKQNSESDSVVG